MRELRCAHFYEDCKAVMRGETDDAVMEEAARHGRDVHGEDPEQWSQDEIRQMRALIHDV